VVVHAHNNLFLNLLRLVFNLLILQVIKPMEKSISIALTRSKAITILNYFWGNFYGSWSFHEATRGLVVDRCPLHIIIVISCAAYKAIVCKTQGHSLEIRLLFILLLVLIIVVTISSMVALVLILAVGRFLLG